MNTVFGEDRTPNKIYSGTRAHIGWTSLLASGYEVDLEPPWYIWLIEGTKLLIDFPLSVAADTALLPLTVPWTLLSERPPTAFDNMRSLALVRHGCALQSSGSALPRVDMPPLSDLVGAADDEWFGSIAEIVVGLMGEDFTAPPIARIRLEVNKNDTPNAFYAAGEPGIDPAIVLTRGLLRNIYENSLKSVGVENPDELIHQVESQASSASMETLSDIGIAMPHLSAAVDALMRLTVADATYLKTLSFVVAHELGHAWMDSSIPSQSEREIAADVFGVIVVALAWGDAQTAAKRADSVEQSSGWNVQDAAALNTMTERDWEMFFLAYGDGGLGGSHIYDSPEARRSRVEAIYNRIVEEIRANGG